MKPPKRREGESTQEYVERLSRLAAQVSNRTVKGIATADGHKSWKDASYLGPVGGAQQANPRVFGGAQFDEKEVFGELDPIKRQTPQQRVEILTKDLVAMAEKSYAQFGEVRLPKSVMDEIGGELWKMGLPAAREQLEIYARSLLEKAFRQNQTNDRIHNIRS